MLANWEFTNCYQVMVSNEALQLYLSNSLPPSPPPFLLSLSPSLFLSFSLSLSSHTPFPQCTISVSLHPTAYKLDAFSSMAVKPDHLFKLITDQKFMCHVVMAACGYRVEESEYFSLPDNLVDLVIESDGVSTEDSQFKALELLSWMVGVHQSNANWYVRSCML